MNFIAISGGSGAIIAGIVYTAWRIRQDRTVALHPAHVEPQSLVHVIESERKLYDAAHRAAQFDRSATEFFRNRANRYEAVLGLEPIAHIRPGRAVQERDSTIATAKGARSI